MKKLPMAIQTFSERIGTFIPFEGEYLSKSRLTSMGAKLARNPQSASSRGFLPSV
jgi:hypothetical protein